MGQRYGHLTLEERCRLRGLMEMDVGKSEIARRLGRHRWTVDRELRRNRCADGYRPDSAARRAWARKLRDSKITRSTRLRTYVEDRLAMGPGADRRANGANGEALAPDAGAQDFLAKTPTLRAKPSPGSWAGFSTERAATSLTRRRRAPPPRDCARQQDRRIVQTEAVRACGGQTSSRRFPASAGDFPEPWRTFPCYESGAATGTGLKTLDNRGAVWVWKADFYPNTLINSLLAGISSRRRVRSRLPAQPAPRYNPLSIRPRRGKFSLFSRVVAMGLLSACLVEGLEYVLCGSAVSEPVDYPHFGQQVLPIVFATFSGPSLAASSPSILGCEAI